MTKQFVIVLTESDKIMNTFTDNYYNFAQPDDYYR